MLSEIGHWLSRLALDKAEMRPGRPLWAGPAGQRGRCMDCGLQIADCGLGRPRTPKGTCVCAGTGYKVTFVDNQGLTFTKPVTLRLQPVTFGYKCLLRASFWVSGSVLPVTSVTKLHLLIIKGLRFAQRLHCGYNRLHFVAPQAAGSLAPLAFSPVRLP